MYPARRPPPPPRRAAGGEVATNFFGGDGGGAGAARPQVPEHRSPRQQHLHGGGGGGGGGGGEGGGLHVSGPVSLLGAASHSDEPPRNAHGGPQRIEHMHPLKFLGAGAFANVFMARDRQSGELYAMKSILKALALKQNKHRQVLAEKRSRPLECRDMAVTWPSRDRCR